MAVLTVDDVDKSYEIEKIDMSPVLSKNSEKGVITAKDLDKLVTLIIKDMNSGKSIIETANKHRVEKDLVESIYRMYSTHQGISTAGIIDRLEIRSIYGK